MITLIGQIQAYNPAAHAIWGVGGLIFLLLGLLLLDDAIAWVVATGRRWLAEAGGEDDEWLDPGAVRSERGPRGGWRPLVALRWVLEALRRRDALRWFWLRRSQVNPGVTAHEPFRPASR